MSSILKGLQLNELSPQTLASYKKKAGADATAADKEGDTKKADKRFSGIVKATKKEFDNDAKGVKEVNNYHANRTGFSRGQRDDERYDLDVQQPTPQVWGLKINGKVWSKDGKYVTFKTKEAALNIRNSILKNRPDLEIGLVTKGGVAEGRYDSGDYYNARMGREYGMDLQTNTTGSSYREPNKGDGAGERGRPQKLKGVSKSLPADAFGRTTGKIPKGKPGTVHSMMRDIDEDELDENCWKGYHKEGNKELFGKTVPNCVKNEGVTEGTETYKQGHAKFHTKTNKQIGPTHYGRGSDKKADSYTKADPRYHEVRPVKEQGVAEGVPQTLRKVVPGYAKREIDKKMDAGKFGKTDADKDANFQRYKKIQDKLNEFAPDGFNGGDDDEGFSPEIAKMAQEDGFTKGVSLVDGATLERAMTINYWHSQHGGMYKQYFAKGFKQGRMNKVNHDNKQYNLNLKLMKDGSVRHGEQGVAEEKCPHCGGVMVSEELMNEKKDACYYKVKSRYKVWPSAYASGALVKCRKKGASNWGNGGKQNESSILEGIERADENLHQWFKEKWVRFGPDGKIRGDCARGDDSEGKPKCLPQSKAHSLGKKGRASAAARKRREDPNPERSGKAINVNTKKKANEEALDEKWSQKYKDSINCSNPKGFSQKAHCQGKNK